MRRVAGSGLEPWADAAHAAAALLARKWVLPVLVALEAGPLRRFQIAVRVTGITPKVLTETLRVLERERLVAPVLARESDVAVGIAYELTPYSRSLEEPIAALARWRQEHDELGGTSSEQRIVSVPEVTEGC